MHKNAAIALACSCVHYLWAVKTNCSRRAAGSSILLLFCRTSEDSEDSAEQLAASISQNDPCYMLAKNPSNSRASLQHATQQYITASFCRKVLTMHSLQRVGLLEAHVWPMMNMLNVAPETPGRNFDSLPAVHPSVVLDPTGVGLFSSSPRRRALLGGGLRCAPAQQESPGRRQGTA